MRFDRSLGNVQIFRNFRVVTSLEKEINDLPFPGPHLAEPLFHKTLHLTDAPRSPQVALQPGFGSLRVILHSRGQIGLSLLTNWENFVGCAFLPVKRRLLQSLQAHT